MNIPENKEQLQHLLIRYLYEDLTADEVVVFEQELETNSVLAQLLEEELRLDSAIPQGIQPQISEERLQGNRWLLRQNLQRQDRTSFSVRQWLANLAEKPFAVGFQAAAMAMTFVLGIYVASPSATQDIIPVVDQMVSSAETADLSPLALINDEDYEIYQFKVNDYDADTGDISLSFSLASQTNITGNVADQDIHSLMAVALQNDIDSASRLDTINALQTVASGNQVYQALIYVLTNDQNPGVRYQAVQSLVALAHEEQVRDALRFALSQDVNPGVRLEAFQALAAYPDQQTLDVFRVRMDRDSNEYIRAQARTIVEESEGDVI
ncbi:MAG: hypothetical protein COA96_02060 [SAR86 cluster bacterium]|uniref:HEAT repeat domain-containing protein n=1 Tax=SAR86 cluster bacterium TaxID=2030880 RepID=A0A2A5B9C5_9GAMM|nr:MAG: hypothetical protein COA96_02060 [SAR86 cluster bacterium]